MELVIPRTMYFEMLAESIYRKLSDCVRISDVNNNVSILLKLLTAQSALNFQAVCILFYLKCTIQCIFQCSCHFVQYFALFFIIFTTYLLYFNYVFILTEEDLIEGYTTGNIINNIFFKVYFSSCDNFNYFIYYLNEFFFQTVCVSLYNAHNIIILKNI